MIVVPEEDFEALAVLEEAAFLMLMHPDQQDELAIFYRTEVEKHVLEHTGDAALAVRLSIKFGEIIDLRRREIAVAAGSNQSGATQ